MQRLVQIALFWLLAGSLAAAQPTFEIGLNSSRSGVIPTAETSHIYVLNLPAGVTQLTIRVDAFGGDADIAVYYGYQEEELFSYSALIPGISSAFTLNNPRAGRYEIYVINLESQPLSYELHVTSSGGQVIPPGPGGASLSITTSTVAPGQQFEVSFSGAPGNRTDWIGLYREEADDLSILTWQYIEGLRSGNRTFTAPSEPGRYNFRLFENNTYTRLAVSDSFEVRTAAQPPPPTTTTTLTIATRTVSPEQQLEVSFSGAPGNWADWIGLYPEDADDLSFLTWQYIEGLHSGSRTFTAPSEPGRYNFRLFANNTYTRLAISDTFEVRVAAQPPTPPTAAVPGSQADAEVLAGTWQHVVVAHTGIRYTGILTFSRMPNGWQGTQQFPHYRVTRDLQEIQFDGSVLNFVSPIGAQTQRYVGRLSVSGGVARLSGTFTQADTGARELPWTAERTY